MPDKIEASSSAIAFFKRVAVGALVLTSGTTARFIGGAAAPSASRSKCPQWPKSDEYLRAEGECSNSTTEPGLMMQKRLAQKGGLHHMFQDFSKVDTLRCLPDTLTFMGYHSFRFDYRMYPRFWHLEYWRSQNEARIFGGDTIVLPKRFMYSPQQLDRHLREVTQSIWGQHQIVFCATHHSSPSQHQFTDWAGREHASDRLIVFAEGAPASFSAVQLKNSGLYQGGEYKSSTDVYLWGMEDANLISANLLIKMYHAPEQISLAEIKSMIANYVLPNPDICTRWQSAFGGSIRPHNSPLSNVLVLTKDAMMAGAQQFIAQTAGGFEDVDISTAYALRCVMDLPRASEGWHTRFFAVVEGARTRSWQRHIEAVAKLHPNARLMVICGAGHIVQLRESLQQSLGSNETRDEHQFVPMAHQEL